MQTFKLEYKHTIFIHHPIYSLLHHTFSLAPGGLKAVNVCVNRPLIEKLFMLSSGSIRIRGETGGVASHHKERLQIQMLQLEFQFHLRAVSLGGLSLHHLHVTCGTRLGSPRCAQSFPHFKLIISHFPPVLLLVQLVLLTLWSRSLNIPEGFLNDCRHRRNLSPGLKWTDSQASRTLANKGLSFNRSVLFLISRRK